MNKKNRQSRNFSRKALDAVNKIIKKYPQEISDISNLGEESRAWLQVKFSQIRECAKNIKFPSKPEWWEDIRLSRNEADHQTEDFADEKMADFLKNTYGYIQKIKSDLESNIERYRQMSKKKRKFENLSSPSLGSKKEKKQLVDAMEDNMNSIMPKYEPIEFPKNDFGQIAKDVVSDITSKADIKDYSNKHEGLEENIQTDILQWLENLNNQLRKEDPFTEEAAFIEEQKALSAKDVAENFVRSRNIIKTNYNKLPSVNEKTRGSIEPSTVNFDFYKDEFTKEKAISEKDVKESKNDDSGNQLKKEENWKSLEKLETYKRNFIGDMEKSLIERKIKWEQELIEKSRKAFLEELYKKIEQFKKLEQLLSPFIEDLGRLWDLSNTPFQTSGFEILERFAQLLENDKSLQELAELLGKQSRAKSSFEKELRDKIDIKQEYHPKSAYRGDLVGITYSDDLSSVLPGEIALLKNEKTKPLFYLKFAEKQLLSYSYESEEEESYIKNQQEEITVEKKEPKGPIIICVDISGSMNGTPENIAKTVTFALSKIAIKEERKCYLISFSTDIATADLSDFKDENALQKLVDFLNMSFSGGGTDAKPALEHSLKMLNEDNYKNADVLMISDFVMGNLPDDLTKSIKEEQEKDTCFYSLVIGNSGNANTIKAFDHNWMYDMSDPNASRHLVKQLHDLKTR